MTTGSASPDPSAALHALRLFPTDRPLTASEMIGRDTEISTISTAVQAGEHQVVVGATHSGKTSLAMAVAALLDPGTWNIVKVDLTRLAGVDQLTEALTPSGELPANDPTEAIAQIGRATTTHRRVLLIVDSFEELVRTNVFGKVTDLGAALRAAIDKAEQITALLVGGGGSVMRGLFSSKDQPFHRFAPVTALAPISQEAWRQGLSERFTAADCVLTDDGADRLIAHGDCHPHGTMRIAQHTLTVALAAGRREVDSDAVDLGLDCAAAAQRPIAEMQLHHLRTLGKHALSTAQRVAAAESPYKGLPPAIARQTLRTLETAGIIDRPKSGTYRIFDPLFRRFLVDLGTAQESAHSLALPPNWLTGLAASQAPLDRPLSATTAPTDPTPAAGDVNPTEPQDHSAEPRPDGGVSVDESIYAERNEPATTAALSDSSDHDLADLVGPSHETSPATRPVTVAPVVVDANTPQHPTQAPGTIDRSQRIEIEQPQPVSETTEPPASSTEANVVEADRRERRDPNRRSIVRHPRREEAPAISDYIAESLGPSATTTPGPRQQADAALQIARFIRQAIHRNPKRYWHVEFEDRPIGGAVLHRPGPLWGRNTPTGLDPLTQAVVLVLTTLLLLVGLALLITHEAWTWGAYVGLIFAAFISALVQMTLLMPRIFAHAWVSWTARRHHGHVLHALWSEPDATVWVLRQLARELPGEFISGRVHTPEHAQALRDAGFCIRHNRLVTGVLGVPLRDSTRHERRPSAAEAPAWPSSSLSAAAKGQTTSTSRPTWPNDDAASAALNTRSISHRHRRR